MEPTLFSFFVNVLEEVMECKLIESADDKHQGTQENKNKCKVLQLGRKNLEQQCRLGTAWLGSSSPERDLGVLADSKLGMACSVPWK